MTAISLTQPAIDALNQQLVAFKAKFGREAGPDDPIFFDPDHPTPRPIPLQKVMDQSLVAMAAAEIRPELIWGFLKTGLLPTEENWSAVSKKNRRDWNKAMNEFDATKPNLSKVVAEASIRIAQNAY